MLSMLWYVLVSSAGSGRAHAHKELDRACKANMQHKSAARQSSISTLLADSSKGFRSTSHVSAKLSSLNPVHTSDQIITF